MDVNNHPELKQWIANSVIAGFSSGSILARLRASGLSASSAEEMLQIVIANESVVGNPALENRPIPVKVAVPEPRLEQSPSHVLVGRRKIRVLMATSMPRVVVFENLLTPQECRELIDLASPKLSRSLVVDMDMEGEETHAARTSKGMFFARAEHPLVHRLETRIAKLVNWPSENGEGLQVLRYGPGEEYKPHYDFFYPGRPGTAKLLKRGGQRVASLVIYLNTPPKGGGTVFPDINLEVMARRGNAVFFSYEQPDPSSKTLHGGAPVIEGEKWVATKWLRQGPFF